MKTTDAPGWDATLSRGDIWDLAASVESQPQMMTADHARVRPHGDWHASPESAGGAAGGSAGR